MQSLSRINGSAPKKALFARGVTGCVALFAFALLAAAGCGGSKCADGGCTGGGGAGGSGGSGGSASCTSTKGTISGTLYLDEAKTNPAAGADVTFTKAGDPGAITLNGMTDSTGSFSVELDPGSWTVSGQEPSGCIPTMPVSVELKACETHSVTLILDTCPG